MLPILDVTGRGMPDISPEKASVCCRLSQASAYKYLLIWFKRPDGSDAQRPLLLVALSCSLNFLERSCNLLQKRLL